MKKLFLLILVAVIGISASTLQAQTNPTNAQPSIDTLAGPSSAGYSPFRLTKDEIHAGVVDYYGEGVYEFYVTRDKFGHALASFLKDHPALEVTSMTGNVIRRRGAVSIDMDDKEPNFRDYGATCSYFVTFREKK